MAEEPQRMELMAPAEGYFRTNALELAMHEGRWSSSLRLAVALLAALVCTPQLDHTTIALGLLIYVVYVAGCLELSRRMRADLASSEFSRSGWWRLGQLSGWLHGTLWACLAFKAFPELDFVEQVELTGLTLILVASTAIFFGATSRGDLGFITLCVCGLATAWLIWGAGGNTLMAATLLAMLLAFLQLAARRGQWQQEQITLMKQNGELVAQLLLRNSELNEAYDRQSRILAEAGHDLRQPLQALAMMVGGLKHDLDETRLRNELSLLNQRVGSITEMFVRLLDESRPNSVDVPRLKSVRLMELLGEVVDGVHEGAQAKGLRLDLDFAPISLRSDPVLLKRLLWNLLSNSVRCTKFGFVRLRCLRDQDGLVIEILDTGPGIDTAAAKESPGKRGIGLSIVREISAALDYRFEIGRREGGGTRAVVGIPAAYVAWPEVA